MAIELKHGIMHKGKKTQSETIYGKRNKSVMILATLKPANHQE